MQIKVLDKILAANDAWAGENRRLLRSHGIRTFNLIGSPGAGKTRLLEATIDALKGQARIGVIEGDIATTRDAERIKGRGVPVVQINTGTACHLDAHLIHSAFKDLIQDSGIDLLFVENIGNLVCPAEFDIGEDAKIAVLSVMEGDDKIEKYPLLFTEAAALVITKMSLLAHCDFQFETACATFRAMNPKAPILALDSLTQEGLQPWLDFLIQYPQAAAGPSPQG